MKRIISLLLTAAMVITMMSITTVTAEDETVILTEEAVTLAELGVIESADVLDANKILTRGEFAKVLSGVLGGADENGSMYFPDVPKEHSAFGAVSKLVEEKIIDGKSNGAFSPDNTITYPEAVKMVVCALGYRDLAEARGGYTAGYISVAASLRLPSGSGELKGALAAKLLIKALDTETAEVSGMSAEGVVSYIGSGKTLMEEKLEIYKVNGQLTENYATALSGDTSIEGGQAVIGDVLYLINDNDAAEYLGYNVTAYVKDQEPLPQVLSVKIDEGKNKVIEINGEDTDKNKTTKTALAYYTGDREQTAKISSVADVIYNGQSVVTSYTAEDFCPESGRVVLIDTDKDGIYDIVKITEYKNVFLDYSMSETAKAFNDKNDASIAYEIDEKGNTVRIIRSNGEAASITDLLENTLLSVAQAKDMGFDSRFITIVINDNVVSGTISSISKEYATIDSVKYEIADDYRGDELKTGYIGDFYLDINGKIAMAKAGSDSDLLYGMIYGVAGSKKGLEETLMVKILTTSNEYETISLSDNFRINDKKVETASELMNILRPTRYLPYNYEAKVAAEPQMAYRDDEIKQVIKYKKNDDGEITKIYTATEENEDILSIDAPLDKRAYKNDNASFGKLYLEFFSTGSTYFLLFPDVTSDYATRNEEKQYSLVKGASSVTLDSSGGTQATVAYDINDGGYAGLIIKEELAGSVKEIGVDAKFSLVTGVEEIYKDDDVCMGITVMINGSESSVIVSEDAKDDIKAIYNELDPGDIIRYSTNRFGEIENMRVDLDYSAFNFDIYNEPILLGSRGGTYQRQDRTIFGAIQKAYKSTTMIATPDVDKLIAGDYENMITEYMLVNKLGAITIFNRSKNEARRGTIADLSKYAYSVNKEARVVYNTGMGMIRALIIYE